MARKTKCKNITKSKKRLTVKSNVIIDHSQLKKEGDKVILDNYKKAVTNYKRASTRYKTAISLKDRLKMASSKKSLIKHDRILKDAQLTYNNLQGGLNSGGLYNDYTGIGGPNDKSSQSFFLPTLFNNRSELETIKNESWSAKRFIELPVDQMFIRPRTFEGLEEENIAYYERYMQYFNLNENLANGMKGARLYGSSFLLFITTEAPLNTPLRLDNLKKGDLKNILVFDRYSTFVVERDYDLTSRNYQKASMYHISPKFGGGFEIHPSRVIRFDGQMPLSSDGWTVYNIDYGVSEIIPVLQSIYQESQAASGISQLIAESSIPIFKIDGLKEVLGPSPAPDSPSLSQLANTVNRFKSIYNTIHLDSKDDFQRQEVSFNGLPDVLDRFASRLAAAAEIPATIFLGKSPLGMNATGDSDLEINAAKVAALQQNKLRPIYDRIDQIMKRTSGLNEKFDYDFPSLLDSSEMEQSEVAFKKTEVVTQNVLADIISTDEAREILNGDPVIGNLEKEGFDFKKEVESEAENQEVEQQDKKEMYLKPRLIKDI